MKRGNCEQCVCFNGRIICSKLPCLSSSLLPCNCPIGDFRPVCATNGVTYPNPCVARCNGFLDEQNQYKMGRCNGRCSGDECSDHVGTACIINPRTCLSTSRPCHQYTCQNRICSQTDQSNMCENAFLQSVAYEACRPLSGSCFLSNFYCLYL